MDYQQAADIRKKGLFSLITDKLVAGQGIGSSIGSSISERTRATVEGFKEKLDPLNIVKTLTFGSNLAPALLGRMFGRKKETIAYFAGGKKNKLKKMMSGGLANQESAEVLEKIYERMLRNEEIKKEDEEQKEKEKNDELKAEDDRNKEIIKALTGKKTKTKKITKPKEKKKPKEKPKAIETIGTGLAVAAAASRFAPTVGKIAKGVASTVTKVGPGAAVLGAVTVATTLKYSDVIAKEEGVSTKAYWDPPDQKKLVSIGYGHQITPEEYKQGFIQAGDEQIPIKGEKGIETKVTKEQAKKLLDIDIPKYEERAAKPLGNSWNKLNDNQKTALVSYAYNVGSTKNLVDAGLKEAIDNGNTELAAKIIREKGIKTASGKFSSALDKRRKREAELFLSTPLRNESTDKTLNMNVNTGSEIERASRENRDAKRQTDLSAPNQKVLNNTTVSSSSSTIPIMESEDDRSAYDIKVKQR